MSDQLFSFTFGGIYLANYGVYLTRRDLQVLPRTREKVIEIPGKSGKLDLGAELGERVLPLPCVMRAPDEATFVSWTRSLANIFDPTKGAQQLILDEEPDKYIMARYNGQLQIPQVVEWSEFELPLVAYDPYWYSLESDVSVFNVTTNNQSNIVQKDAQSIAEYPKLRIINNGTSAVGNITIARINTK